MNSKKSQYDTNDEKEQLLSASSNDNESSYNAKRETIIINDGKMTYCEMCPQVYRGMKSYVNLSHKTNKSVKQI